MSNILNPELSQLQNYNKDALSNRESSCIKTPQFCYSSNNILQQSLEDVMKGIQDQDHKNMGNTNIFPLKLQLPQQQNMMSIKAYLSASQSEASEKDRAISNETVGLNSTTELTPKGSQQSHLPEKQTFSFSPIKQNYDQRQPPQSAGKLIFSQSIANDSQNENMSCKKNLFNTQCPLTPSVQQDRTLKDIKNFKLMHKVGEGAYGVVWSALHLQSQRLYAIKIIQKSRVEKLDKVQEIQNEKNILSRLNHPNIVKLHSSFIDQKNVYMVMDYAINGDFASYLKLNRNLTEKQAQFYIAQLINILVFLRGKNIIHRDLKPGNILFDDKWHLILADFGTAKQIDPKQSIASNNLALKKQASDMLTFTSALNRGASSANDILGQNKSSDNQSCFDEILTNSDLELESKGSFVGTEDYIAPEIINNEESTFASDLWSLGVIMFQFFTGKTPFKGASPFYTFENIQACDYKIPDYVPSKAKDLIQKLLVLNPAQRLGASQSDSQDGYSIDDLKLHPFFNGLNFSTLHLQVSPIDTSSIISSPIKKQLMQYLPNKGKNLTQEFQKDLVLKQDEQSANQTKNTANHYNNRQRDFSDLVRLQKSSNKLLELKSMDILPQVKLSKAASTNNIKEISKISSLSPSSSIQGSPNIQRLSIKKIVSTADLRPQALFQSQAIPSKHQLCMDKDFFYDSLSTWKEVKKQYVKKKSKLIFYVDRLLKIYENDYFAYFTSKHKDLKASVHPKCLLSCTLESKDKIKIVTRQKTYLFKFAQSKTAQEWVSHLNKIIAKYQNE